MKINQLIARLPILWRNNEQDIEIKNVDADSRKMERGSLFVAVVGTTSDGHDFIDQAIAQGAVAVVCQTLPTNIDTHVIYLQVANTNEAMGILASDWYGNPSASLILVGVTGTNGKTTIATLLYDLFRSFGEKVGLLSTVCNYIDGRAVPATHTTPDPLSLNHLLKEMVESGCRYAFMEVSSHASQQRRIAGLDFDGGIFTNLTRDHLDYHLTVEAYLKAKKLFFDTLPATAFALTNADDKVGNVMLQNTKATPYTYSLRTLAPFKGRIVESHFDGTLLEINGREIFLQFVGKFNAYNLLAVYGAACLLGRDSEEVLLHLSSLTPVAGRFQTFRSPQGTTAIIDYAHTPDALENVLSTINGVLNSKGEVIAVVGCGGNRDKGKRPLMAQEALRGANKVILTSDNPRGEEPQDIINDMLAGVEASQRRSLLTIVDRREAIRTALMMAKPEDVVLIAGKGHEDYQEIKGVKHHFDDKEEVLTFFAASSK